MPLTDYPVLQRQQVNEKKVPDGSGGYTTSYEVVIETKIYRKVHETLVDAQNDLNNILNQMIELTP